MTLPAQVRSSAAMRSSGPHYNLQHINVVPRHRILVVDDVKASAETLAMMLQAMGQSVVALHDGPVAIDWVLANKPDAVFLDIAMPTMSGYEVARRLRENADCAGTVLIALTGYGQDDDRRQAFEAGFDHHLVKPTSIEALAQVLGAVPCHPQEAEPASVSKAPA